jgi:hypothetical protein
LVPASTASSVGSISGYTGALKAAALRDMQQQRIVYSGGRSTAR